MVMEMEMEMEMATNLYERTGQDYAISSISNCIRVSRSGLGSANRPIGGFLFLGSSGIERRVMGLGMGMVMVMAVVCRRG